MKANKETTIEAPHSSTILCNPIAEHALSAIEKSSSSFFVNNNLEWAWWCRDIAIAALQNDSNRVARLAAKVGYIAEGL